MNSKDRRRPARDAAAGTALVLLLATGLFAAAGLKVKVTAELANIRQKPSISSVIIRQFPQGEILEAVRKEGEWYLVRFDPDEGGATTGYVHESLVLALDEIPAQPAPAKAVEPPAKPETVPVPQPKVEKPPEKAVIEAAAAEAAASEAAAREENAGRIGVTIYGGGRLVAGGDLNTAAQGLADYYTEIAGVAGDQKIQPAHLGLLYGAEISLPLSSQFYVVFGAEYHGAQKSTLVSYATEAGTDTFSATPGFQALPLKLGLAFYPLDFLYIKVGAAYYFAKVSYDYRYLHDNASQEWQGDATAQGYGVWGGLGLDWPFAAAISLVAEATGEYASITGFHGTGTYLDSTLTSPTTETGFLYFWDARTSSQTAYPAAFLRSKTPAEAGVENARQATADFTGLAVRVGFKIRF